VTFGASRVAGTEKIFDDTAPDDDLDIEEWMRMQEEAFAKAWDNPEDAIYDTLAAENKDWRERISRDPEVCHGQACIKGTRMMVSAILDNLAANRSVEQIVASYPTIGPEDVAAAIEYGQAVSINE
jgi:uncharacterized protein (DUF433 family)